LALSISRALRQIASVRNHNLHLAWDRSAD
jgi:hypothetical protein